MYNVGVYRRDPGTCCCCIDKAVGVVMLVLLDVLVAIAPFVKVRFFSVDSHRGWWGVSLSAILLAILGVIAIWAKSNAAAIGWQVIKTFQALALAIVGGYVLLVGVHAMDYYEPGQLDQDALRQCLIIGIVIILMSSVEFYFINVMNVWRKVSCH